MPQALDIEALVRKHGGRPAPAAPPVDAIARRHGGRRGMLEPGNIDLFAQPEVENPKGGTSTVYSFSANFDGNEYLLPMVMPDGRLLDEEAAIAEFQKTGKHLGVFNSPDSATVFAKQLHDDYESGKYRRSLEAPPATFLERLTDLGLSALKGAIGVPEAAIGLADIPTGGRAGKALESVGFSPKLAKSILDSFYSQQQQQANRSLAEAKGLVDTAVTAMKNPSTIVQAVVESLPTMLSGAGVARGLVRVGAPVLGAAAAGEGAVSAGLAAEGMRGESDTGTLTPKQAAIAVASGVGTGALGFLGGRIARRLGIADIDTLLAGAVTDRTARTNLVKGVIFGAVQEGFLEELPQSVQEQILQNIAQNRPWEDGIDQAAVLGALAGAVMGGGGQVVNAARPTARPSSLPADTPAPIPTPAPAVTAPVAETSGPTPIEQMAARHGGRPAGTPLPIPGPLPGSAQTTAQAPVAASAPPTTVEAPQAASPQPAAAPVAPPTVVAGEPHRAQLEARVLAARAEGREDYDAIEKLQALEPSQQSDIAAIAEKHGGRLVGEGEAASPTDAPTLPLSVAELQQQAVIATRQEDWGTGRGGGKRIGAGMVVGAMGDPPRGIKTYPDFEHSPGVTSDIWEELRVLDDEDKRIAIGALQAGMAPDDAFRLAYTPAEQRDAALGELRDAARAAEKPSTPPTRLGNPFTDKAIHARREYERLVQPTARDQSMAMAFPLGTGYGRKGGERRLDATIDKAVKAEEARKTAEYLEAQSAAFDRGEINAQGRRITVASVARSEKRQSSQQGREARIASARETRGDKPAWAVPVAIYADASGQLAGSGRKLVEADHRTSVEQALSEGQPVPGNVLADYPDLKVDTIDTGKQQPRLPEAGAVREQDVATPQLEAPFSLSSGVAERPAGQQASLLDRNAVEAQTSTRESAEQSPRPGTGTAGRHTRRRDSSRAAGRPDDVLFVDVLDAAKRVAQDVDPADLRAEFDFRLEIVRDAHAAFAESGHDPLDLLRTIAARGGLGPESFEGYSGEIRLLKENAGPFGTLMGVKGVFRKPTRNSRGQTETGHGLDDMVKYLHGEVRFQWIETVDDLYKALDDATRAVSNPHLGDLLKEAGITEDRAWWLNSWRQPQEQASAQPGDAAEDGLEDADTSFDPDDLEESADLRVADFQASGVSGDANVGVFTEDEPVRPGTMPSSPPPSLLFPPPPRSGVPPGTQPIEFPELLELAKALQGVPQVVKAFRKAGKLGDFRGDRGIRLHAELFKKGNEYQLAAALAHEVGHLVDWLPDQTLKRGNLLGRLRSLQSFLKQSFTADDGTTIKLATVRAELTALSDKWRPWDPKTASPGFRQYRHSSKELYADAISVLLNNPGLLQSEAPTFYRLFFEHLDQKPDVERAYFDLQEVLSGTRDELVWRRRSGVRRMFEEGDAKALDLERRRVEALKQRGKDLWFRLKTQLVDKNYAVIDRVRSLQKQGVRIADDDNPLYLLEERNYLGGKLKAFTERHFAPIFKTLTEADVSWHAFGEALFYERIIAGDRSELANPRGLSPKAAAELYDSLKTELGGERSRILSQSIPAFRAVVKGVAEEAHDAGLYTDELYAQMQANPAYVSFQVLDHMEDGVTSRVHKQVGTLKDIANVADASILKTLVTLRAIEHQKVKRATFAFLKQQYAGDIQPAKTVWSGKGHRPIESKDPDQKLITYFEKGKLAGYYVDPYVAAALENESVGQNWAVLQLLRVPNKVFRPLFTSLNLGFQGFNVMRDFWRFWKNVPTMTLPRAMKRYLEAVPVAKLRAFGTPDRAMTPKELAAYKDLLDAEEAQILSVTFNDLILGRQVEDTQVEDILARTGVGGFRVTPRHPFTRPFLTVLEWIKETGDFIETLPKAAGLYEFKGKGPITGITATQRSFIRRKIGSPDYLAGGTLKPVSNELFLFSNAITQAMRSDLEVATEPKTRSGFWWKTAKLNLLPKVLLWGALSGLLGDTLRRLLQRTSEYDRTNYLILPLGEDERGNTVYVRLPQDDSGRLIGGLFWKFLQIARGEPDVVKTLAQVVDYTAGQVPSVTPAITAGKDIVSFAAGQNPYDDFRGRNLFTDDELKARDWRSLKKFVGYEFQNLGGSIVWKFYPGEQRPRELSRGQRILDLPVLSNVIGRFIRVTNFGEVESLRGAKAQTERDEARRRLREREAVYDTVRALGAAPKPGAVIVAAAKIAGELYPDDPQEAGRRMPELRQAISLGLLRGKNNALLDALLSAGSNRQKVAIIQQAIKDGQVGAPPAVGQ